MTFVDPQHAFEASYPSKTARFRHDLTNDPLFEIDRILKLIASVPPKSIEYNSANISHDHDPAKMPSNGLSPEETVRNIADINSWLVVMNIEQDPEYKAMMERCRRCRAACAREDRADEPYSGLYLRLVAACNDAVSYGSRAQHPDPDPRRENYVHLHGAGLFDAAAGSA
ncbi:MAG TPA: hypothetical protein PK585_09675 [Amphiplicatus sp.]|nr:hypothetical protein [Amphiplicatus sp.]